jgi:hypothetical protein
MTTPSVYLQVLAIAQEQSEALQRGEVERAVALLDRRAALLACTTTPTPDEVPVVKEILRLDRDLSSAIRERMIRIRGEAVETRHGQHVLDGYGRNMPRRPLAIDRQS